MTSEREDKRLARPSTCASTCAALFCTTACGNWIEKAGARIGPPACVEKAQTMSSLTATGTQPKFIASYMRFDEGESPTGMGQNTARVR